MKSEEEIKELWDRYCANRCTREEVHQLLQYIQSKEGVVFVGTLIDNGLIDDLPEKFKTDLDLDVFLKEAFEHIAGRTIRKPRGKQVTFVYARYAAAAIFLLGMGVAAYFLWQSGINDSIASEELNTSQPIPSGLNNVLLTLADGSEVKLNENNKAMIETSPNVVARKSPGALTYTKGLKKDADATEGYNRVSTSKGGQYKITLLDGTKVWLNAASSLRYPVEFKGKDRVVELVGEGYFEVAKDPAKPFHVRVSNMDVTVLGTVFNINAYSDERFVKTTLLEGSVKVEGTTGAKKALVIKPGEQAILNPRGDIAAIHVDGRDITGWKDGVFRFSGNSIDGILRQISRWYDIDLAYLGQIPKIEIAGDMPLNTKLGDLVSVLKSSGLDIRMEEHKLVIGSTE